MEKFVKHSGKAVVIDLANIDTDQIIPKQFLKRIERTGYGQFLFYDWRFNSDGSRNEDFILNRPEAEGASILIAGNNFGCGSSREHAPWSLLDHGFRVIIAADFADIFYNNSFKNGLLPIKLAPETVSELMQQWKSDGGLQLVVDLENCKIVTSSGDEISFVVDDFRRECLLLGLDDIGLTLQHEDKITAYEQAAGI